MVPGIPSIPNEQSKINKRPNGLGLWELVIFSIWEQCTMGKLLRGVGD